MPLSDPPVHRTAARASPRACASPATRQPTMAQFLDGLPATLDFTAFERLSAEPVKPPAYEQVAGGAVMSFS